MVGLGYWKIPKNRTAELTVAAIQAGYRHLDLACDYGNESEAGRGIAEAIDRGLVRREDLWITSKLWNTYHRPEHVRPALQRTLADLRIDYLDAYLIHFPIAQRFVDFDQRYPPEWFYDPEADSPRVELDSVPIVDTFNAMGDCVDGGLIRTIGVCNFGVSLIRDLIASSRHRISILQVEMHPRLTQATLLRFAQQQSIAVTAFSPFGPSSYVELSMAREDESLLHDETVRSVANDVGRTPAQVLLRWAVQRGTAVIPKTQTPERLAENLSVFDFELSPEQHQRIASLDQHRRYNDPGDFAESAFNTFLPIYE